MLLGTCLKQRFNQAAAGGTCPDVQAASKHPGVAPASGLSVCWRTSPRKTQTAPGEMRTHGRSWSKHQLTSQSLTSVSSKSWWLLRASIQTLFIVDSAFFFNVYIKFRHTSPCRYLWHNSRNSSSNNPSPYKQQTACPSNSVLPKLWCSIWKTCSLFVHLPGRFNLLCDVVQWIIDTAIMQRNRNNRITCGVAPPHCFCFLSAWASLWQFYCKERIVFS